MDRLGQGHSYDHGRRTRRWSRGEGEGLGRWQRVWGDGEEGLQLPESTRKKRNPPTNAWLPGQTGNPGGRPKNLSDVRDLARQHTVAAIATLATLMADEDAKPSTRVAAADALLDRAWGKPTQPIEHRAGEQSIIPMDEVERRLREIGRLPAPVAVDVEGAEGH